VVLIAAAVSTVRRRRAVEREVVTPIKGLLHTIAQLQSGELGARSAPSDVYQIGDALAELASSLDTARHDAVARESRLATLAARFETVTRVGREISGSLSVSVPLSRRSRRPARVSG